MNFMNQAFLLAKKALSHGDVPIGAVIVRDGKIVARGENRVQKSKNPTLHAEIVAINHACKKLGTKFLDDCDLYVTLEPCCHHGKTPPCTDIIIEKRIKRVFVGSLDSNPLVAGKGISILKEHGIEVITGILEEECLKMNEIFFHYITNKTPFTAVKYAMTLDGKIAAYTGDSKWVTNEKSREHVHYLRKKYAGIMVGINTVIKDNPMLNCRIEEGVDPVRIIVDSTLRLPSLGNQIVETAKEIRTIVAYCASNENESILKKKCELMEKGIEVIAVPSEEKSEQSAIKVVESKQEVNTLCLEGHEKVNMKKLMMILGKMKIDSVLIEGGGEVNASAFEAGIVQKVYAYIAPKIIMGRDAKTPVSGGGIALMKDAVQLKNVSIKEFDGDLLVEGYVI